MRSSRILAACGLAATMTVSAVAPASADPAADIQASVSKLSSTQNNQTSSEINKSLSSLDPVLERGGSSKAASSAVGSAGVPKNSLPAKVIEVVVGATIFFAIFGALRTIFFNLTGK